jgi:hypothetical protein
VRRDDLPLVTLDGRHAAELLGHPCTCGRPMCTLGTHIWESTRDMTPGPKAQSFEPAMATGSVHTDTDPRPDPTTIIDVRFAQAVQTYWNSARELTRLVDALRPDRWTPLPEPATDDQWCTNHLEVLGACEPRYRGDLCRFCYDLKCTYGAVPDRQLMQARHERGYGSDRDINEWLTRTAKPKSRKRKKAS